MLINRTASLTLWITVLLAILTTGCGTQKNNTYFQTIPYNSEIQTLITKDFEPKIKTDDILQISIISPSEEVKNFNTSPDGFYVDKNGNIQVYKLGEVKVVGLTLPQVKERLTKLLIPDYFKEATVTVRFKNHRVIMLGEVSSPGVIPLETEHLSILEAISMKGDLKETARRDNILVIRNTPNGKQFFRVNLLDGSIFNSPFYYLHDEDIVYVEQEPEKKKGNVQQIYSYLISGISLFLLIFDRVTR